MNLPLAQSGLAVPDVAAGQAGAFTRRQALAAGWSAASQVERRVAAGAWLVVTRVVLVSAATSRTALTSAWAVRLTWPDAVVSHWTAAALHGFPVPSGVPALHAVVARRRRSTSSVVAHRLDLDDHEVLRLGGRDGPLVTTPQRTAFDCLRGSPPDGARQLLAWLLTRKVLSRKELAAEAATTVGRRGTPALVALLARTRGDALSEAERRLHAVLRRYGVLGWTANATLRLPDRSVVVDVLFEQERVVIEVDGWASHGTREAFEQDRRRQNALVNAGYVVLRFTWRDLTEREVDVVREIRSARDRWLSS